MKKVILAAKKMAVPSQDIIKSKKQIADLAFNLVKKEAENFSEIIGLELGGSYAKGTWLDNADIDIFLKFKNSTTKEKFEEISKSIGFSSMKKFKPYVRYSEHPYVEARIKKTKINVVPCYDVKGGEWKSAADRSPFHTRYMQKALTSKMKDDVRILKKFLKSTGIYGAEIAKQGFSGYVSEVLVLNYGTFENVIKSISKIKENEVIGNTVKKFDTIIVIIDPIDSNRNLASAISNQNIGKFVLACRSFLVNPLQEFFVKSKRKKSYNWKNVLVVKFNFRPRSPDVIWGQIKRATSFLTTQLKMDGFNVLRSMTHTDEKNEAYLFFLLESPVIPERYMKKGPEFLMEDGCRRYIEKNRTSTELMWVDTDMRVSSLEKRKYNDVVRYTREFLKNNLQTGIPKGIQGDLNKGFKVFLGDKNLRKSIKEVALELISTDEKIFHSN